MSKIEIDVQESVRSVIIFVLTWIFTAVPHGSLPYLIGRCDASRFEVRLTHILSQTSELRVAIGRKKMGCIHQVKLKLYTE